MSCNVYFFNQSEWFIVSMSQTTFGVWVANGRVVRLPQDASDETLGKGVLDLLASSQTGVAHPTDGKAFRQQYKDSLGVKNVNKFERGSLLLAVQQAADSFTITPYRTEKQGHMELPDKLGLDASDPAQLGAGIRECLGRCKMAV
jgi:hypothetical protein